ncbi:adenosine deaminase [Kineococcus xinjiangensis]|uniref:adenosine deaminase n=1 Tax=Kineococcus xinjiangensis TaxID=512762 RepID=A0A2S6IU34_9ACTN|nr:adenosine deaminase [Kineococcus xinjiangensis]PPK97681.1 adenosine deaminase [Kineococcus xinjiangensis]
MAADVPTPTADLLDTVRALPKVSLHDHLDGGLRPETIVEIASANGHALPTTDPDELREWFRTAADSGSLELYLETFAHTTAVMQDAESLARVATETVLDLAADGVVYGELRYAPEQHLTQGLSLDEVVLAVEEGFRRGEQLAAEQGRTIRVGTLVTAMRHAERGLEIAELALRHRDAGVVGFDIAGAEAGFPPTRQLEAFRMLHEGEFPVTIHAGEAAGLESIREAVAVCGTQRIGHGVRIVDDIEVLGGTDDAGRPRVRLGRTASWVRDRRIPLELCPTSNVQTGAASSVAEHPVTLLKDLRFRVTVNTDNRLVSGTSLSREFALLVEQAGWTLDDVRWATTNAARAAFLPYDERIRIISSVVEPGFAAAQGRTPRHAAG